MFREGKIDEETVDCPRFVAFKGASREDSSSSFNLGQLTKRIHGESDEFDEEEARQAQRKDRRRRAPFYLESPIGFTFTWNRPLCAVLMLLGGGGGGGDPQVFLWFLQAQWVTHPKKLNCSASCVARFTLAFACLCLQSMHHTLFFVGCKKRNVLKFSHMICHGFFFQAVIRLLFLLAAIAWWTALIKTAYRTRRSRRSSISTYLNSFRWHG